MLAIDDYRVTVKHIATYDGEARTVEQLAAAGGDDARARR